MQAVAAAGAATAPRRSWMITTARGCRGGRLGEEPLTRERLRRLFDRYVEEEARAAAG